MAASLSRLDILTNTLLWRHMAPTAPDTLPCYPFGDSDPFVISPHYLPHVYFAGGGGSYGSRWVPGTGGAAGSGVRVVSVPDFSSTGTAVLVDLTSPTLQTQALVFSVPSSGGGGGGGGAAMAE